MFPTLGVEIEIPYVISTSLRSTIQRIIPNCNTSMGDDGSIRHANHGYASGDSSFISVLPIVVNGSRIFPAGTRNVETRGVEVITAPYSADDMRQHVEQLALLLYKIPCTPRASVHTHISGFQNWLHIQNLIRWFYYLEAALYRLASFGQRHRGEQSFNGVPQDYNYCRPLSNPIYYFRKNREIPLLNIDEVLNAKSYGRMLAAWGRLDYWATEGGLGHYCPHRLMGLNIVSLLRYGTVELRLWNGSYKHLSEIIDITIALFNLSKDGNKPPFNEPMVLGNKYDVSAQDMTHILGVPVNHIWGKRWPRGCNGPLISHYTHHMEAIPDSYEFRSVSY